MRGGEQSSGLFDRSLLALMLLGGGVLTLGGLTLGTVVARRASSEERAGLFLPAESLQVGEAWASTRVEHRVVVCNRSSEPVRIDGFFIACPCVEVEPRSLELAAGGESPLTIRFTIPDLPRHPDQETDIPIIPIIGNRTTLVEPWVFKIVPRLAARFVPAYPNVGEVFDDEFGKPRELGALALHERLVVEDVESAPWVHLHWDEFAAADGEVPGEFEVSLPSVMRRFPLRVVFDEPPQFGAFSVPVRLRTRWLSGERGPTVDTNLRGRVTFAVRCTPEEIHAGGYLMGEEMSWEFVLTHARGEPFDVIDCRATGGLIVRETIPASGDPHSSVPLIRVDGEVRRQGWSSGQVEIQVRERSHPLVRTLGIPVSWHGLAVSP